MTVEETQEAERLAGEQAGKEASEGTISEGTEAWLSDKFGIANEAKDIDEDMKEFLKGRFD